MDLTLPLAFLENPSELFTAGAAVTLLTLLVLEIVLGIDNVVFIAILSNKLPEHQQAKARNTGLLLAMVMRVGLLFAITWVMTLDKTVLFELPDVFPEIGSRAPDDPGASISTSAATGNAAEGSTRGDATHDGSGAGDADVIEEGAEATHIKHPLQVTGKELILFIGGLFLVGKATYEIHDKLEGDEHQVGGAKKAAVSFASVIVQVLILDLVFSIDSVITAVGIADRIEIMIVAVVVAVLVMLVGAGPISRFVEKHPAMKLLALSFLVLIGVILIVEAFEVHVPKGYIYFAMAFAFVIEMLNIQIRKARGGKSVDLRQSYVESESSSGYGDVAEGGLKRPGLRAFVQAADIPPTTPS